MTTSFSALVEHKSCPSLIFNLKLDFITCLSKTRYYKLHYYLAFLI